jgi:hypothetical protein
MSGVMLLAEGAEGAHSRELLHATFRVIDCLHPLLSFRIPAAKGIFEGCEVGVEVDDA